MIQKHKAIFFNTADYLNCILGVREPNILSDRFIGLPGYLPKMQQCKAKTANNEDHPFGGLVVDPVLCPEAFTYKSLSDAIDKWNNKFLQSNALPAYFSRATSGPEKGLLKYQGSAIHADYDLMYISAATKKGEHKYTGQGDEQLLFRKAQGMLNRGFGTNMIQHGSEFAWKGVGAAEHERVFIFKPRGKFGMADSAVSRNIAEWH